MILPYDEFWMQIALKAAQSAAQRNEVPVGAVLVRDNRLLSIGSNSPVTTVDCTHHAEIDAIRQASKLVGNYRLAGTTLYVTLEPCMMCMGAISHARIQRLVYSLSEPKFGSMSLIGKEIPLASRLQIDSGVMADRVKLLMENFFKSRR